MSNAIQHCDRCETRVMCHMERRCMVPSKAPWHREMAKRWINLGKNFSFATPRDEAAQRAREHLRWAREARP